MTKHIAPVTNLQSKPEEGILIASCYVCDRDYDIPLYGFMSHGTQRQWISILINEHLQDDAVRFAEATLAVES